MSEDMVDYVHSHPLDHGHATAVAGLQTTGTPDRAARATDAADQTLVQHQFHRGPDGVVVPAHDEQPLEYPFAGAGVKCRDHLMTGQSRANGEIRRLVVLDFARAARHLLRQDPQVLSSRP
jgi:hypothetical protein